MATAAKTSLLNELAFCKLCHAYSNLLKMSNVDESPWIWFLGDHTQVLKEKEKFFVACLRPPYEIGDSQAIAMQ